MPVSPESTSVGFIGTGVMGSAMAGHLIDAGYRLVVYNRTRAKADALVARGATWADSAGEAAAAADVVITMVGFPADVEDAYLGEGGIVARAREGALLVDMTTSSPGLAARIAEATASRGLRALDAPVSGGDVGARNATLTIMVGGAQEALDEAMPLFEIMGRTVALHGGPGSGQHCKMANQIAIAATMLGMAECLAYAKGAGLDEARVIETLSGGSAQTWTLSNYGPRVLSGDYKPGFYVKHFVKDLRIAIGEAEAMSVQLPGLELAKKLYEAILDGRGGDLGTQAIALLYADSAAREANGLPGGLSTSTAAE